jgi:hypothetical protein
MRSSSRRERSSHQQSCLHWCLSQCHTCSFNQPLLALTGCAGAAVMLCCVAAQCLSDPDFSTQANAASTFSCQDSSSSPPYDSGLECTADCVNSDYVGGYKATCLSDGSNEWKYGGSCTPSKSARLLQTTLPPSPHRVHNAAVLPNVVSRLLIR